MRNLGDLNLKAAVPSMSDVLGELSLTAELPSVTAIMASSLACRSHSMANKRPSDCSSLLFNKVTLREPTADLILEFVKGISLEILGSVLI